MWYQKQLFDTRGRLVRQADLQDRSVWYSHGLRKEQKFVRLYGTRLGLRLNPDKEQSMTAFDLRFKGRPADLKAQNTPFFVAQKRYKLDPQTTVTFNLKDALKYGPFGEAYSRLSIFFWVHWVATEMRMGKGTYRVHPMKGVWRIPFSKLDRLRLDAPIHWYNERGFGTSRERDPKRARLLSRFEPRLKTPEGIIAVRSARGNAAGSYLFSLDSMERID